MLHLSRWWFFLSHKSQLYTFRTFQTVDQISFPGQTNTLFQYQTTTKVVPLIFLTTITLQTHTAYHHETYWNDWPVLLVNSLWIEWHLWYQKSWGWHWAFCWFGFVYQDHKWSRSKVIFSFTHHWIQMKIQSKYY